jgi:hypothetical protein
MTSPKSLIDFNAFLRTIRNNPEPMSDEAIGLAAQYVAARKDKESALAMLRVLEAMLEFTDPSYRGKISAAARHLLECDRRTVERTRDTFKRLVIAIKDRL